MGVAIYMRTKPASKWAATAMDGKALAAEIEKLNRACSDCAVKPLEAFYSVEMDDLDALLDESDFVAADGTERTLEEARAVALPDAPFQVEWFDAADGLVSVRMLREVIGNGDINLNRTEAVGRDLEDLESSLVKARVEDRRFHLSIDY